MSLLCYTFIDKTSSPVLIGSTGSPRLPQGILVAMPHQPDPGRQRLGWQQDRPRPA